MKINHIAGFAFFTAFAAVQPVQAGDISADAAELFQKAVAAHGGEALEQVAGYQDEGSMFTFDAMGEVAQESVVRSFVDYENGRVRSEILQDGQVFLIQQAGPDGGYAWNVMAGELPVTPGEADELLLALSTGIHGLIAGLDDADSATVLGEMSFGGADGIGLEVTRDGRIVVLLVDEAGTLVGDSYESSQLGTVQTVYTDYETVDGILVPSAYEVYGFGMKLMAGELTRIEFATEIDESLFGTEPSSAGAEVSAETLEWLADNVVPFDSVEAGSGFADLEDFGTMVGDARVVALGEQTHGTAEFFTMKHRLLEYLVEEKDFTIFAIEANLPEAFLIDDYIKSGEGDSQGLLEGLYFWTWYTQEVLDMIEWMRDYNQTSDNPVHFVGFDMQFPNVATAELRSFLAEADPEYLLEIEPVLTALEQAFSLTSVPEPLTTEQIEDVADIATELAERRDHYAVTADDQTVDRALQFARIAAQAAGLMGGNVAFRDAAMAENVEWLLEQYPGEKMVIWAHNGHVAESDGWMGGQLDDALGDDYFSVAFSFYEGEYRAVNTETGTVAVNTAEPALDGSVDGVFNSVGPERLFLDLREVAGTPAETWLAEERLFRSIGALAVPASASFAPTNLSEDFDAVIFIRESTASDLLEPIVQ